MAKLVLFEINCWFLTTGSVYIYYKNDTKIYATTFCRCLSYLHNLNSLIMFKLLYIAAVCD